ncbi:calcium/sodium antiporter [Spiribacter sp. 218]|uniref:calcium/sodium antiporter n=1 Tax=Spiribacter pallidus TaxID=1987936 RepID=UPI00349FC2A0
MEFLLPAIVIVTGFVALAWSADRFVAGASAVARQLGVSPVLIGLTVVGIGTSLPEMLVSTIAALDGTPGVALGNALGSNIANVGLILGITALVMPIAMRSAVLRREYPLLLGVVGLTALLLADARISRGDGLVLLAAMAGVLIWMGRTARRADHDADIMTREIRQALPAPMPLRQAVVWLVVGLVVLLISARLLVISAVALAQALGVSDLVIGLTIVAVGTSLPELAAAISSVRRGEDDLAIGNILGSNIFNLLAVLGIAGAIAPFATDGASLARDYAIMSGFMVAIVAMGYGPGRRGHLDRGEGAILLAAFIAYQVMLFLGGS